MTAIVRRLSVPVAALLLASAGAPTARAQELPSAQSLIERYGKAVGGDAWKSHTSARMKAKLEMASAGIMANIEAVTIFPSQYMMKMEIPGMGSVESGFDGTVAWSRDPMTGPRLLAGPEAEQVVEEAEPEASMRTSAKIVSSETVEKTAFNGQDCYKVKHTWKSGRITYDCFAVSDGLIIATIAKQASAMGEMEVTTLQGDYKDFGGMKRATTVTAQMMGQEARTTVTSWEWDTVAPKDMELPADIKALIPKKP